jgi:uncharacterized protein YndB with AHSA1/START domain
MEKGNETVTGAAVRDLVINRIFEAPRELVFKAWTDPKHMARWWGPKDFTNPVCEIDPRPGGKILIHMHGPDGAIHPMTGVFQEVVRFERLVFTSLAFENKNGDFGLEVLNTVTFSEFNGKTILSLTAKITRYTPEVAQAIAGMNQGWNQSLDRLSTVFVKK